MHGRTTRGWEPQQLQQRTLLSISASLVSIGGFGKPSTSASVRSIAIEKICWIIGYVKDAHRKRFARI